MMAAWREVEESQASEEEEEGEDEDEDGCWEYDSTWEDDDDDDEEEEEQQQQQQQQQQQNDGAAGRLEEEQERTEPDAAAEDTEKAVHREAPQRRRQQQPGAKWAQGNQEQRKSNFSFGFGRFKSTRGRNWMAARDMQRYRRHYPGLEETDTEAREEEMWNLSFYKNEIRFLPRGLYIDELLDVWQNDYKTLEENHSYIQWLFPLREQGMNWRAKLLTCREIQAFRKSKEVMDRFIQVYQLMLGFYGISLTNKETGELSRAGNWRERFQNLNLYSHNNLRITRILKCLGELGFEHYQVHLVKFFLMETLVHQTLPRVQKSAMDYFMFTVRNKQKRRELVHFAWQHFDRKRDFVWGPRRKLLKFKPRSPELLSDQKFEEEPKEGAREAEGENQTKPPNETCTVAHAADRTALPSNDPVPDRETTSTVESDTLQAASAAESQPTPVTELEASEELRESSPASAAREGAKGCRGTEGAPVSSLELEREGLAGESESGRGGADGDSLKESKKRKLEMNKLGKERVALAKSPTDIERISCNLEGVVIDKEGPDCHPEAEERCEPLAPEGGGSKGADSVDAMVKRRKVDEMVAKDSAAGRTGEASAEVPSFQGHVTNCIGPGIQRPDQVHQEEARVVDTSREALTDGRIVGVHLSVGSGNPTEPEAPSGVSVTDKVDEQGPTCMAEGEELQPCERLPASKKAEEGGKGQVEGGEGATGEGERPTQKPDVKELHPKQD
ncbi:hypothetical protein lerEdw1_002084 [Lerista edwardsae]|nr:hypothetical protein lerEdw1_002084 [Lerista edwardsae]